MGVPSGTSGTKIRRRKSVLQARSMLGTDDAMPDSDQPDGLENVGFPGAGSMLAYWGTDLRCRYANRAYEHWFGVASDTLIGRSIRDMLGPELFARHEPHIRAALAGSKQVVERVVPGREGVRREGVARYTPDIIDGRVVGFVAEVTDEGRPGFDPMS